MELKDVQHSHLDIRGLSLHLAVIGDGHQSVLVLFLFLSLSSQSHSCSRSLYDDARELGTVVFLHGFLEIWYSWRHQMIAVADAGFRAIAPDLQGYGLSDHPPEGETASWEDLVADLLAILDSMATPKVFLVGKDFGAIPAYSFAVRYPDRVSGVVTLGVPFFPKGFSFEGIPEGFYVSRWRDISQICGSG